MPKIAASSSPLWMQLQSQGEREKQGSVHVHRGVHVLASSYSMPRDAKWPHPFTVPSGAAASSIHHSRRALASAAEVANPAGPGQKVTSTQGSEVDVYGY